MSDYSIYPKAVDGYAQIPLAIDKKSPINAESVNRLRSGVINIEKAIGIAPEFSSEFGSFPDLTSRVDNIEDLFVGLHSGMEHSLTELVEGLDISSFVEDLSLTGLYERDNVIHLSDEPLYLEGEHLLTLSDFGNSYLDFFADENFIISSSTGIELQARGTTPADFVSPEWPAEWPKSVVIRESDTVPFPIPDQPEDASVCTYLSLGGEMNESDLLIGKVEGAPGGGAKMIVLAAGINAATDDSLDPVTLSISSMEALKPGAGGGRVNISAGNSLYEPDGAGGVRIESSNHPLADRATIEVEGPDVGSAGSISLYSGHHDIHGAGTIRLEGAVDINGSSKMGGSLSLPIETWTGNNLDSLYPLTDSNFTLLVYAEQDCQVVLPVADDSNRGRLYHIKRIDDPVATAAVLHVNPSVGQLLDGDPPFTFLLCNQWNMVSVQSDGGSWYIIGTNF